MTLVIANRWAQLGWGVLMLVAGVAIGYVLFSGSGGSEFSAIGDDVSLTSGGTVKRAGRYVDAGSIAGVEHRVTEDMPLTSAQASLLGWKGVGPCEPGIGRYFRKAAAGVEVPYLLMYSQGDELIGIYQFSRAEMPAPWQPHETLATGGQAVVDFPHWGLMVYFRNPAQACVASDLG